MTTLPPLVQALLKRKAYPNKPQYVELVQTQISFVFLLGEYVYKVKKPVDFGYLDFSTLEKRRFYCEQEVSLNRRLSPEIYLGVVSISQKNNEFQVEGIGKPIEYAVKMRQLPQERCLNILLDNNQVTPQMLQDVAKRLVEFHTTSKSNSEISKYGGIDTITQNTDENFAQTEKYTGISLSKSTFNAIQSYTRNFITRETSLFRQRINEGKIRDCHGDLHSEHVCFGDKVYIFDCIEFNDRFRYCDVASEIAFLAMDIDFHSHCDLSRHFVNAYADLSDDYNLIRLMDFYKCYFAYVRGKTESFELDDPHISEDEKADVLEIAKKYFKLAHSYIS